MTDFADEESERTEAQIADALAKRMPEGSKATGYCLECGEYFWKPHAVPGMVVYDERRWCNAECRDMWENRQR